MAIKYVLSDITKLNVDAIVNATNEHFIATGGLDSTIHQNAGIELLEFCKKLELGKTTEVKISRGFNLPVKYIIHAVGPVYKNGDDKEIAELYETYKNALNLALKYEIKTIAFPLISAGANGFPKQLAIDIAQNAINDFLETNEMDISLVFYDRSIFDNLPEDKYENLLKFIGSNFVEHEIFLYRTQSEKTDFRRLSKIISSEADVSPTLEKIVDNFADKLNKWMIKKDIASTTIWKKANIDRKLFSKIFNGSQPSKKTAILLTLALELNIDDSLDLLNRAGYTLSNALKEDIVVKWYIENNIYSVYEVCETQMKLGLPTIF